MRYRATVILPLGPGEASGEALRRTEESLVAQRADLDQLELLRVDVDPATSDDWLGNAISRSTNDLFVVLFPGDTCERGSLATLAAHFEPNHHQALSPPAPGTSELADGPVAMVYADHRITDATAYTRQPIVSDGDPADPATIAAVADIPSAVVYKPAPSPMFALGKNYVANAAMYDRSVLAEGPFDTDPITALHDLTLRGLNAGARSVTSVLFELSTPIGHLTPSTVAVKSHLERVDRAAEVTVGSSNNIDVRFHLQDQPMISVIIPTRGSIGRVWGTRRSFVVDAVSSMIEHCDYPAVEYVVVCDTGTPLAVRAALERIGGDQVVLVDYAAPFNFSDKINVGVEGATGEMLLLLNDDTELIAADSLREMASLAVQPEIGVVGARLLYADGTLQHGGHVYSGQMLHACVGWPGDSPGPAPLTPLAVTRELSGVTAAAAMVRRAVFEQVGGFDVDLPINFNDVDFSLKVLTAGYRNLWTPHAVWYHFETVTRSGKVDASEIDMIYGRWNTQLLDDPYYHPALERKTTDWRAPAEFYLGD